MLASLNNSTYFSSMNKWTTCLISSVQFSRSVVSDSLRPQELYSLWNFPGQNTGVGSLSFLQEIFPTQGSSLGLPHADRFFTS